MRSQVLMLVVGAVAAAPPSAMAAAEDAPTAVREHLEALLDQEARSFGVGRRSVYRGQLRLERQNEPELPFQAIQGASYNSGLSLHTADRSVLRLQSVPTGILVIHETSHRNLRSAEVGLGDPRLRCAGDLTEQGPLVCTIDRLLLAPRDGFPPEDYLSAYLARVPTGDLTLEVLAGATPYSDIGNAAREAGHSRREGPIAFVHLGGEVEFDVDVTIPLLNGCTIKTCSSRVSYGAELAIPDGRLEESSARILEIGAPTRGCECSLW